MSFDRELQKRSDNKCELCGSEEACIDYAIPSSPNNKIETHLWLCPTCTTQINSPETADINHWRCLNESVWSELPAVQIASWRMLQKLKDHDWVRDLLDIVYMDDETMAWAQAAGDGVNTDDIEKHRDSNGAILENGDNVVLIKTLEVKGATFNAKMGTVVRKIRLVEDNTEHIEGKVNGSQIVILTKYVRKANPKE